MGKVSKSVKAKFQISVQLVFQLSQHERDQELLSFIVKYLNCGFIQNRRNTIDLRVTKFKEICDIIIPFFIKYPVLGEKAKDLEDFIKIAELMKEKVHLTKDGLELITKICSHMNRGRVS